MLLKIIYVTFLAISFLIYINGKMLQLLMAETKSQDLQRMILRKLLYCKEQTNHQLAEYMQLKLHSHIEQEESSEFKYEFYEESYMKDIQKMIHDVSNQTKELLRQKILERKSLEVREPYRDSVREITRLAYYIPSTIPCLKRLLENIDIYYKEACVWDVILFLNSPYLKGLVPELVSMLLSKATSLFYYRVGSPPITETEKAKIELLVRMSLANLKWVLSSFEVSENDQVSIVNPPIFQPAPRLWDFQEGIEIDRKLKRSEIQEQFEDLPKKEIDEMLREDEEKFRREVTLYIHDLLINVNTDKNVIRDILNSGDFRLLYAAYYGEDICNEFMKLFESREITFDAKYSLPDPNPDIPPSEWEAE